MNGSLEIASLLSGGVLRLVALVLIVAFAIDEHSDLPNRDQGSEQQIADQDRQHHPVPPRVLLHPGGSLKNCKQLYLFTILVDFHS